MDFYEIVIQVTELLQQQGRVTYRGLKLHFKLDDETLEALKEEILYSQPQAVDDEGRGLIWTGEAVTQPESASAPPAQPEVASEVQPTEDEATPEPPHPAPHPDAERRQLTVMFCDLADSTRLSGQLDPEDLRDVIRAYQTTSAEVIDRYGGYIAQHLGDGLMVYFGWPQAHEDDAQRAVYAGLGILAAMRPLNMRLERDKGIRLAVRIGLHTGPVVVGEIGGGNRHEHLALGETINIASRLEGLASPNTVLVSDVTARLVQGAFEREDLGRHELKGVAEPVSVFLIIRERTAAEHVTTGATDSDLALVGRGPELALLLDRWAQSKDGRGQAILVNGEAGIGKTRLVAALRAHVLSEGYRRMAFRCSPYHINSALYPLITHLEQLLRFIRDDTPEAKFAKLEQALAAYAFPQIDTLSRLATLLSIPLPAHVSASPLTPEQQKQKTQEDLLAWLVEEAERQPVLVVWEDIQWIDPSSLDMLSLMIEHAPTSWMLIAMTCRPEFEPPWGNRSHLTPMTLGNLGPTQIETLATNIAGGKTLPTEIVVQITEKTDGVPLFVEEMTKAILESGGLRDAGTHHELIGSLEAVTIPITLHDSLMARLDRLDTAKRLAQLGAVIGRQFPYELVQMLVPLDETILQRELRRLVDAELLYQRGLPPRATYLFKHALIQDVAYESLLRQRRQALHCDIAQAIETLESDHLEEQVVLLAYHYARSTQQDKAIAYALLAGDRAAGLYANAEATTYFEQALALAQSLPDTPNMQGMQIDAILKLAAVGEGQNIERDRQHLEQARHLAEALRDDPRLARVLYWQGRIHYAGGDLRTAITYAEQSLAIADRLGDETLAAPPVNLLGRSAFMLSDFARASQLLARSTEQMHQLDNVSEEATAAALAGMAFGCLGEFRQALAFGDRGLRLAQEQQNPFAVAAAYQYRAIIHDQRGAWSQMISDCEAARRVAERAGDLFRVYLVKMFEGQAHTMTGQAKQGRAHLEESVALAAQFGTTFGLSWSKAYLAACLLALGEYQSARRVCHEAIELAEATGHTFSQALAHRLLAETLAILTPADVQAAEDAILEAIRLQREMDNNPELARSFVIYARLLRGWRQVDKATEYLNRALDLFQRLDMSWDLARAVAECG